MGEQVLKKIVQYEVPELLECKEAEALLHILEEWFRVIFEKAMDGIVLADAESKKLLLGNDAFCRLLGYTQEEIKGLSILDLHPKEDQFHVMNEYYRQGEVAPASFPVKSKNGHNFYADITPVYLKIGGSRYLVGFFRDVTVRKQTVQLLREGETDFQAIFEHSPIAMVVSVGVEEKVLMVNQKFTELFGYTLEDTYDLDRRWVLFYPNEKYREEVKAEWTKRIEQAIQNHGIIEPMETSLTCKDGSRRYVRFSFSSMGSRNIVTCEDLTIRKCMETALQESEARYRSVFESAGDLIYTIKSDGTLTGSSGNCVHSG